MNQILPALLAAAGFVVLISYAFFWLLTKDKEKSLRWSLCVLILLVVALIFIF